MRAELITFSVFQSFCNEHKELPIYLQWWWWEAICAEHSWQVWAVINEDQQVVGILPLYHHNNWWGTTYRNPIFTTYQPLWIALPQNPNAKAIGIKRYQQKILSTLIQALPKKARFQLQMAPTFQDLLPFYWEGFQLHTRLTYSIHPNQSVEELFKKIKATTRNQIRTAESKYSLTQSNDADAFFTLMEAGFKKKNLSCPYPKDIFLKMDQALAQRNARLILQASPMGEEQVGTAIYCLKEANVWRYKFSGQSLHQKSPGAQQLLLWNGIKIALSEGKAIDFEGSMYPEVAATFQSFAAEPLPYLQLIRYASKLEQLLAIIMSKRK